MNFLPIVTPVVLVLNGAIIAPLERLFFLTIHTTTPAIMATHIIAPTAAPGDRTTAVKRKKLKWNCSNSYLVQWPSFPASKPNLLEF